MNIIIHVVNPNDHQVRSIGFAHATPPDKLADVDYQSPWPRISELLTWYETRDSEAEDPWTLVKEFKTESPIRCAEFNMMPGNYSCVLVVTREKDGE